MKVLLDECCPQPLRTALSGAEIFTVDMAKLKGLKNGELVKAAEASFDVLITADKSLRYQQNLARKPARHHRTPFQFLVTS
jgi:predicted nuclease of predicted toxin-antitoxin system